MNPIAVDIVEVWIKGLLKIDLAVSRSGKSTERSASLVAAAADGNVAVQRITEKRPRAYNLSVAVKLIRAGHDNGSALAR